MVYWQTSMENTALADLGAVAKQFVMKFFRTKKNVAKYFFEKKEIFSFKEFVNKKVMLIKTFS